MSRPVIGIMGNFYLINDQYPAHAAGTMNCEAIAELCNATPLIIPGDPEFVRVDELMRICDGFLFTGGRPNVHPSEVLKKLKLTEILIEGAMLLACLLLEIA